MNTTENTTKDRVTEPQVRAIALDMMKAAFDLNHVLPSHLFCHFHYYAHVQQVTVQIIDDGFVQVWAASVYLTGSLAEPAKAKKIQIALEMALRKKAIPTERFK